MASMAGTNFTGRLGAWSAHHWKTAVFAWIGFVAVAFIIGQAAGMTMLTGADSMTGQSATAHRITDGAGMANTAAESVLVHSGSRPVSAPAFRDVIGAVAQRLRDQPYVSEVQSPLDVMKTSHAVRLSSRRGC
jgi:predicted RND superfamily exporter protein